MFIQYVQLNLSFNLEKNNTALKLQHHVFVGATVIPWMRLFHSINTKLISTWK